MTISTDTPDVLPRLDSLVRIEVREDRAECCSCHYFWDVPLFSLERDDALKCPKCDSGLVSRYRQGGRLRYAWVEREGDGG